jgi:hypothetical protein
VTQCDTCAFTKGCETHDKEPDNRLKSLICARAGIPFFCHHGFDWQTAEVFQINRRFVVMGGQGQPSHICQGWKRAVQKLNSIGWYSSDPQIRKIQIEVGRAALVHLRRFIDSPDGSEEKNQAHQDLHFCCVMLFKPGLENDEETTYG